MPFVTQSYLNYLESQLGGGEGGGQLGGIDIPPADTSPQTTTAPWSGPATGGPGSFPAPSPTPTPQTPQQWGPGTNFVPMPISYPVQTPQGLNPGPINDTMPLPEGGDPNATPTPPPYFYNDPYGTGDPGNVNIPQPGQNPTYGGVPAPSSYDPNSPPPPGGQPAGAPPQPGQSSQPGQAPQPPGGGGIHSVLSNFFHSLGALFPGDPGGFGQPMGFFGIPGQNPIGMFGVGGPTMPAGGGSYFGGRAGDPFGIAGSTYGLGSGGGGTIAGLGGKLAWHEAQPMFGGRTLAQVARENPELLPGLIGMGSNGPGSGSPAQQTGGGHAPVSGT